MTLGIVSVIIPVSNVLPWLDSCLTSVTRQTYRSLEVILVDDGSTDGSAPLCDLWASRDDRIAVVHLESGGSSRARNAGLDRATGDYITFVDSDDVVSEHLIGHLLEMLLAYRADAAVGNLSPFQDGTLPHFTLGGPTTVGTGREILRMIVCGRPRWGTPVKLYRRSLLDDLRFPEGLMHQDLHLAPRIFERAGRAVLTDDILYGYRLRPGSVMDSRRRHGVTSPDLTTILSENIAFTRENYDSPQERDQFTAAYLLHASKQLEMLDSEMWSANQPYLRAYRSFVREHWPLMLKNRVVSPQYRAMWLLSGVSPWAFSRATGTIHQLKRRGRLRIRRLT